MYKLLMFLKKTDDENVYNHFNNYTLRYLSGLTGKVISAGEVESSLLLDQKYSLFCEATLNSKEEWDQKMNSREGKLFNKDLMDLHQFITIIFVNYKENQ